jgi:hypothetical protein
MLSAPLVRSDGRPQLVCGPSLATGLHGSEPYASSLFPKIYRFPCTPAPPATTGAKEGDSPMGTLSALCPNSSVRIIPPYDIFEILNNGVRWIEAVDTLDTARARVAELKETKPAEYLIVNQRTGITIRVSVGEEELRSAPSRASDKA